MGKKKTDFTAAAQEATASMFSGFQKPIEQAQQVSADNPNNAMPEATEQANASSQTAPRPKQKQASKGGKRQTHKLYAAWIDKDTLSKWKAYTDTKNITTEELMMCAVNHYIERVFPIEPEEQEKYEEYLEHERQLINENARGKRL